MRLVEAVAAGNLVVSVQMHNHAVEVLQLHVASVVVSLGMQVDGTFRCNQTAARTGTSIRPSPGATSCLFCFGTVVATFTVRGLDPLVDC